MILTGPKIRAEVSNGRQEIADGAMKLVRLCEHEPVTTMDRIHIDPYNPSHVGPNSVDLCLGNKLLVYEAGLRRHETHGIFNILDPRPRPVLDMGNENKTHPLEIGDEGLILWPGVLYLGTTIESIGSNKYVPIVEGRSSVGRLGLHVHVTAGFCDLGFKGQITLEIHVIHPIRVYAGVPICQAYFLKPEGEIQLYKGRYQDQENGPVASRIHMPPGNR